MRTRTILAYERRAASAEHRAAAALLIPQPHAPPPSPLRALGVDDVPLEGFVEALMRGPQASAAITFATFIAGVGAAAGAPPRALEEAKPALRSIFRRADGGGKEKLTRAELAAAFCAYLCGDLESSCRSVFMLCAGQGGLLAHAELCEFLRAMLRLAADADPVGAAEAGSAEETADTCWASASIERRDSGLPFAAFRMWFVGEAEGADLVASPGSPAGMRQRVGSPISIMRQRASVSPQPRQRSPSPQPRTMTSSPLRSLSLSPRLSLSPKIDHQLAPLLQRAPSSSSSSLPLPRPRAASPSPIVLAVSSSLLSASAFTNPSPPRKFVSTTLAATSLRPQPQLAPPAPLPALSQSVLAILRAARSGPTDEPPPTCTAAALLPPPRTWSPTAFPRLLPPGIVHHCATEGGVALWSCPILSGAMATTRSSDCPWEMGAARSALGRESVRCGTYFRDGPGWQLFDFGRANRVAVNAYAVRHGQPNGRGRLRCWVLEGSVDGQSWSTLRSHEEDAALRDAPFATAMWAVEGAAAQIRSRFLRLTVTGPNSSGLRDLWICGFEVYGALHVAD